MNASKANTPGQRRERSNFGLYIQLTVIGLVIILFNVLVWSPFSPRDSAPGKTDIKDVKADSPADKTVKVDKKDDSPVNKITDPPAKMVKNDVPPVKNDDPLPKVTKKVAKPMVDPVSTSTSVAVAAQNKGNGKGVAKGKAIKSAAILSKSKKGKFWKAARVNVPPAPVQAPPPPTNAKPIQVAKSDPNNPAPPIKGQARMFADLLKKINQYTPKLKKGNAAPMPDPAVVLNSLDPHCKVWYVCDAPIKSPITSQTRAPLEEIQKEIEKLGGSAKISQVRRRISPFQTVGSYQITWQLYKPVETKPIPIAEAHALKALLTQFHFIVRLKPMQPKVQPPVVKGPRFVVSYIHPRTNRGLIHKSVYRLAEIKNYLDDLKVGTRLELYSRRIAPGRSERYYLLKWQLITKRHSDPLPESEAKQMETQLRKYGFETERKQVSD